MLHLMDQQSPGIALLLIPLSSPRNRPSESPELPPQPRSRLHNRRGGCWRILRRHGLACRRTGRILCLHLEPVAKAQIANSKSRPVVEVASWPLGPSCSFLDAAELLQELVPANNAILAAALESVRSIKARTTWRRRIAVCQAVSV